MSLVDLIINDRVALLTLNDPGTRNALTGAKMLDSITDAHRQAVVAYVERLFESAVTMGGD